MRRQGFQCLIGLIALPFFVLGLPAPLRAENAFDSFVPQGWEILMQAEGDMNQDGKSDAAIVLGQPEEKSLPREREFSRRLVLLLAKPEGGYREAAKTEQAVLCASCGGVFGDPLADIKIEKGVLVIDHYGGSRFRWGWTHRWRHQDGDWALIGKTDFSHDTASQESKKDDRNLLTGDRILEITDENGKTKVTKTREPKKTLQKLSTFKIE